MSIHKRVLRVTDEADEKTRAHAERYGIGVYDAATLLLLRGLEAAGEKGSHQASCILSRVDDGDWNEGTAANYRATYDKEPPCTCAESSGPTQADFDAMKADRDRLKIECEEADEARRVVETASNASPDPRVTAYAEETSATYADALDKLVRLGISRARALDKHAAGKRAA